MSVLETFSPYSAEIGFDPAEDIAFAIAFVAADGRTPVSLSGITLTFSIGPEIKISATGGDGQNIATIFVPASLHSNWYPGGWPLRLVATDGFLTKVLFGVGSTLTLVPGASSPLLLRPVGVLPAWATRLVPAVPILSAAVGGVHIGTDLNIGSTEL